MNFITDTKTEVLLPDVARFPRAKLQVVKGPNKGAEVVLEGQTVVVGSDASCQVRIEDSSVSRQHFELSGGPGGYRLRDLKSTNGVFVEGLQVHEARLLGKVRIRVGRSELRFEPEGQQIEWPLSPKERFGEVLGRATSMRRVFAVLERASQSDSPVVLEGEVGTGREALARSIHMVSTRREGPFITVDLGNSSEQLTDSDLFGRDVTSSRPVSRPGAFEEANGGTLFLDEVTDLTFPQQAKLLRVLESKEVKRPGPGAPTKVDVRVLASTTKDLGAEVKSGQFREDLFFKLAVFRVRVPPLRERPDDVPLLVRHFESKSRFTPLTEETVEMLTRHDWPGNVRELRNVLERIAAMPDLGASAVEAASKPVTGGPDSGTGEISKDLLSLPYHEAKERVLESFEKTYLLDHLKQAGGVVTRAAQRAGLPRQSVHRMLRRLGISHTED